MARPRRFDRLIAIGPPNEVQRRLYFKTKQPKLSNKVLAKWVKLSKGLSLAALADIVISVSCMGKTIEEATDLMKKLEAGNANSSDFLQNLGDDE